MPRKVYHVTPHQDGWQVKKEGADRASAVRATKEEVIGAARELALNNKPSQIKIHKRDGTI